jgi:hypothetical protein
MDVVVSCHVAFLVQLLTPALSRLHLEPRRATRELFDEVGAEGEGDENSIIALLRDGADPNAKSSGRTHPLFEAAKHGHFKAIKTLTKHGADADATNGEVGLLFMWGKQHVFLYSFSFLLLVEMGTQLVSPSTVFTQSKHTALHAAVMAKKDSERCISALLASGADSSVKNKDGRTPYALASESVAGRGCQSSRDEPAR